jgi:peptide/nickel transport system permease protein
LRLGFRRFHIFEQRGRLSVTGWVGVGLCAAVVTVGLLGPFFAPFAPDELIGAAYAKPSLDHVLGLDYLGRDVLSRFLWGGRTALALAFLATLLGYAIGLPIGLIAAYRRRWTDQVLMRANDVALAFPGLIFVLLLLSAFGSDVKLIVLAVALANAPRVARIVRASALEVVSLPYVEAARARGEPGYWVGGREIMPNIAAPILVDFGIRLTGSILLVAGVSFLGLGLQPPAADWGLMIAENRGGITIQPWAVVAPVLAIGLLTIGINLIIDGYGASERARAEELVVPSR